MVLANDDDHVTDWASETLGDSGQRLENDQDRREQNGNCGIELKANALAARGLPNNPKWLASVLRWSSPSGLLMAPLQKNQLDVHRQQLLDKIILSHGLRRCEILKFTASSQPLCVAGIHRPLIEIRYEKNGFS
jgi:hypothetical protein